MNTLDQDTTAMFTTLPILPSNSNSNSSTNTNGDMPVIATPALPQTFSGITSAPQAAPEVANADTQFGLNLFPDMGNFDNSPEVAAIFESPEMIAFINQFPMDVDPALAGFLAPGGGAELAIPAQQPLDTTATGMAIMPSLGQASPAGDSHSVSVPVSMTASTSASTSPSKKRLAEDTLTPPGTGAGAHAHAPTYSLPPTPEDDDPVFVGPAPKKRKEKDPRFQPTSEQAARMEQVHQKDQHPDVATRLELANEFQVPIKKINTWFSNRHNKKSEIWGIPDYEPPVAEMLKLYEPEMRALLRDADPELKLLPSFIFRMKGWTRAMRFGTKENPAPRGADYAVALRPSPPQLIVAIIHDHAAYRVTIPVHPGAMKGVGIWDVTSRHKKAGAVTIRTTINPNVARFARFDPDTNAWVPVGDFTGGCNLESAPVELVGWDPVMFENNKAIQAVLALETQREADLEKERVRAQREQEMVEATKARKGKGKAGGLTLPGGGDAANFQFTFQAPVPVDAAGIPGVQMAPAAMGGFTPPGSSARPKTQRAHGLMIQSVPHSPAQIQHDAIQYAPLQIQKPQPYGVARGSKPSSLVLPAGVPIDVNATAPHIAGNGLSPTMPTPPLDAYYDTNDQQFAFTANDEAGVVDPVSALNTPIRTPGTGQAYGFPPASSRGRSVPMVAVDGYTAMDVNGNQVTYSMNNMDNMGDTNFGTYTHWDAEGTQYLQADQLQGSLARPVSASAAPGAPGVIAVPAPHALQAAQLH